MIIIQDFPTVASLAGWLNNARLRHGKHDFAAWLSQYMTGRDMVVNGRQYRYHDCINLVREAYGNGLG